VDKVGTKQTSTDKQRNQFICTRALKKIK